MMWAKVAGSSSVFKSAFWLSSAIASACSTTKTRWSPSNGRYGAASMIRSRTSSTRCCAPAGRSHARSG